MYTCINSFAAILNGLHQEKKFIKRNDLSCVCLNSLQIIVIYTIIFKFYKFDALKLIYNNEIDLYTLFKFLLITVYGFSAYILSPVCLYTFNISWTQSCDNTHTYTRLQLKVCEIKTIFNHANRFVFGCDLL